MGTNFYWKELPKELEQYTKNVDMSNEDNILMHIGKRSVAGLYCKECGCTFHKYGTDQIHGELNPYFDLNKPLEEYEKEKNLYWYTKCPVCGKEGTYICTFRWTFMKQKQLIEQLSLNPKTLSKKLIVNEYEEEFTPTEFLWDELNNCKVEYQSANEFC